MVELIQEPTMAKKAQHGGKRERAGRPKSSDEGYAAVKVEKSLLDMARYVALDRKVPVAKVVSELLRTPLEKAYNQVVRKLKTTGHEES